MTVPRPSAHQKPRSDQSRLFIHNGRVCYDTLFHQTIHEIAGPSKYHYFTGAFSIALTTGETVSIRSSLLVTFV